MKKLSFFLRCIYIISKINNERLNNLHSFSAGSTNSVSGSVGARRSGNIEYDFAHNVRGLAGLYLFAGNQIQVHVITGQTFEICGFWSTLLIFISNEKKSLKILLNFQFAYFFYIASASAELIN